MSHSFQKHFTFHSVIYFDHKMSISKSQFFAEIGTGGQKREKKHFSSSNFAYFNNIEFCVVFSFETSMSQSFQKQFTFYSVTYFDHVVSVSKPQFFGKNGRRWSKTVKKAFFSTQFLDISTMSKFFLVFCIETLMSQYRIIRGGHNSFRLLKFLNSP